MTKKLSLLIITTCLFSIFGIYYAYAKIKAPQTIPQTASITIKNQAGEEHNFTVELATTPRQQQIGLMHREDMDKKAGMLFIFPAAEKQAFWMKNTHIPLDILYLEETGRINQIYKMTTPFSTKPLPSSSPAIAVLEINGGLSDDLNIKEGDIVQYPIFSNKDAQ